VRQVGCDNERPVEEDALDLSPANLVHLPVLVRVSRIPFKSRAACKIIWESLHAMYITPIYRTGKS
jgi:hypothetical protein